MREPVPVERPKRARLPASAYAYIDSRGRRRLPIHDEARERARKPILNAAKQYGIVPGDSSQVSAEPRR